MTSTADAPPPPSTAAVILAAGGGSRFGGDGHKLLALFRGRAIVAHAVDAPLAAGFAMVIVVTGSVDLTGVLPDAAVVAHNPDWASGQATSVQAGIAAAAAAGCDALVVGLGDQPLVGPGPWSALAASSAPIAVATYAGQRRNPVRLAKDVWHLLPTTGDEGARALMRVRTDLVSEVPCQGEPADIDTLEDLERWN